MRVVQQKKKTTEWNGSTLLLYRPQPESPLCWQEPAVLGICRTSESQALKNTTGSLRFFHCAFGPSFTIDRLLRCQITELQMNPETTECFKKRLTWCSWPLNKFKTVINTHPWLPPRNHGNLRGPLKRWPLSSLATEVWPHTDPVAHVCAVRRSCGKHWTSVLVLATAKWFQHICILIEKWAHFGCLFLMKHKLLSVYSVLWTDANRNDIVILCFPSTALWLFAECYCIQRFTVLFCIYFYCYFFQNYCFFFSM